MNSPVPLIHQYAKSTVHEKNQDRYGKQRALQDGFTSGNAAGAAASFD